MITVMNANHADLGWAMKENRIPKALIMSLFFLSDYLFRQHLRFNINQASGCTVILLSLSKSMNVTRTFIISHREIAQVYHYLTSLGKSFKNTSKRMGQFHQKRVFRARFQQMRIKSIIVSSQCPYLALVAP